ncbi:uncharacterized protein LOC111126387 isoform X1 [Crassostrea virginica]
MSDERPEFVFRNPYNADATEQTSTCGSDCEETRDPESIQQEKKAPDSTQNSEKSFEFSAPIVNRMVATWSDNEQCTSKENCTTTPQRTHNSKLSEIGLLADQVQQPCFGEKNPYMGGGLYKGFIGQQHNVQTPGLVDQQETGPRHVFGSSHPSSLQSFEDISSTKTSSSSFFDAQKSEWAGKTYDASTNNLQLRDNKTNFDSGADVIHSTTSIGLEIPNKTTTELHRKSFPTPTFGEKNPHLGVHQSDFQVAAHIPSIRALSLSGQQQDMKQVTAFEKTSDAPVFGSNTQSLQAFCEISSTNAGGFMFGPNGQMEEAPETIPQTSAFQGFRTEAPDSDVFQTIPSSYENATTAEENPTVNQENYNLPGNELEKNLNFPGLKSSRFSNQHLNISGTPTQIEVCLICKKAYSDCVIDCRHLVICMTCAEGIKNCPLCQERIGDRRQIFWHV